MKPTPTGSRERIDRPFVGFPSFLRAPICQDLDRFAGAIAVLGVPFDEGSPFMPGTRFGPRALREHSLRFVGGEGGYFDPQSNHAYLDVERAHELIVDIGDVDVAPTNVERTFQNATDMTRHALQQDALIVVLGGDHSITYPIVRGFDQKLHVIHFDAHLDYEPFVHDLRYTNAHAFRHIRPMAHVESLIQVGIRSLRHSADVVQQARSDGNRVVSMTDFRRLAPSAIGAMVPRDAACYVSIDVDVLDMSLIPGCVSAEPDGMTYAELRDALKGIAEHCTVVGFDLVEINPMLDVPTGATAYLGAHTITEFLGHICDQPRWAAHRQRWLA
jgi:agmatinase